MLLIIFLSFISFVGFYFVTQASYLLNYNIKILFKIFLSINNNKIDKLKKSSLLLLLYF